ncbi:hypothetical protein JM654_16965 [Microbacterium oxydans]|nr:hypothetical protein [Microbacterium oxydans]
MLTDGPELYYPLGTVAQDVAGTNSPLLRSGATPQPSGVPKGVAGATALDGTVTGRVDTTTKVAAPSSFSAELWFQTSTTSWRVVVRLPELGHRASRRTSTEPSTCQTTAA